MIGKEEINRRAKEEGLRFDQVEKDHVILWVLRALAQPDLKPAGWVFKGGTCLRHCYYAGYRFSEDLDFSCSDRSGGIASAQALLERGTRWIQDTAALRVGVKEARTIEDDFQTEIPLEYSRGGPRRQGLPEIKIHLTFDEPILTDSLLRQVKPVYSDLSEFSIFAYSKEEIVSEKMRALLQQQAKWPRPRDLYDLWFIFCRQHESFDREKLKELFARKCQARSIKADRSLLVAEPLRDLLMGAWKRQMDPVLKTVPEFEVVWEEWVKVCQHLFA